MKDGNEKNLNRKSAYNEMEMSTVNNDGTAKNDTEMQTSLLNNTTMMTSRVDKRE